MLNGHFSGSSTQDSEIRTVTPTNNMLNLAACLNKFDDHNFSATDSGFEIEATKTFDTSLLESLDLAGLDMNDPPCSIKYGVTFDEDASTVFLSITIDEEDDIEIVDTVPGLVTINDGGEALLI